MPTRPNTESKLISALINAADVEAASTFGVLPEMFVAHRQEYEWLIKFPKAYGHQPNHESLLTKFTDFPYSEAYADVQFICDEVKEKHTHRRMVNLLQAAGEALRNGDTEEAYEFFRSAQPPEASMISRPKNVLWDERVLEVYERDVDRIDTPWKTLQKETGGPAAGDFWILAARPGQGKSWTLGSLARKALLDGKKVVLYSLEMPEFQVLSRVHAMLAYELGVPVKHSDLHGRTFDPMAYRQLLRAIRDKVPGELYVIDTSKGQVTTSTIAATIAGMDLALVDYAGLLSTGTGTRAVDDWRTMALISNTLKETAIAHNVPIITAAQINREGETHGWKPPKLKNLAQSDALGQDADVVVTMKKRSKNVAVYSIEKNRHGESDVLFHTRFQPNDGRFEEISHEAAGELVERDAERED
jgi:replicative DNA helicase